jgi:hypothetical protein
MTQVLNFVRSLPPQVIGTGIALFSAVVPRGQQEMVVGKYFAIQRPPPFPFMRSLKAVYGDKIAVIYQNPKALWVLGHLLELSHKVLAAASLYFTLSPLPNFIKTAQVAQPILQKAYPIILLTPAILKLVHMVLDYPSISPSLKPWCDKVHRLAQQGESLFYSPITLFFPNGFGAGLVGLWAFFRAAQNYFSPILYLRDFIVFLVTGLLYFNTGCRANKMPPPRALETLETQFKAIGLCPESIGTVTELEKILGGVKPAFQELEKERLISVELVWDRVLPSIRPNINKFLTQLLYTPLTKKDFRPLEHEAPLRRIFSSQGLIKSINDPGSRSEEYYLFANMLLLANLCRLAEKKDLPRSQSDLIQLILCCQAVSAWGGDQLIPYKARGSDFDVLRQMFRITIGDCALSSPTLITHLNIVANDIGADLIVYPNGGAPTPEQLKTLFAMLVKGDVTQLIDSLPSQELKDLAKKTDATFDEICEAVGKLPK